MKKIHLNSLFFKLAVSVMCGTLVLAVSLFYGNVQASERIFSEMFASAQEKIFEQIEKQFYEFYMDIAQISESVADNGQVQDYLTKNCGNSAEEQKVTYNMQKAVERMKMREHDGLMLFISGTNGRSYMYAHADVLSISQSAVFELPVTKEAARHPDTLICRYMKTGFTDTSKNEPVVVMCRTVTDSARRIVGYVYLMIKESEMREFYDYFVSQTSDIVVFNQAGEVISTNNRAYLLPYGEPLLHLKEIVAQAKQERIYRTARMENGERITYLVQQFSNTEFVIAGTVNAKKAFYEKYNLARNILLAFVTAFCIILLIFVLVRRQTRPINRLVESMRRQKRSDFGAYVPVEGTDEIRELSSTYNDMITDLRGYINKVVEGEKAKRTVELHALQMQINPHYIYNTLASIKWLIMQGSSNDSIEMIDAFIALLRNTISNADEFITVRQEEENLKNYVKINRMRYGNKVHVEFYIADECMDAAVPKLALQPFIENAFFHAFPKERRGTINVFIHRDGARLAIEIADDGVGMTKERLDGMLSGEQRREHFTGIGVHNVDERLKLLYGMEYGVQIESEQDCGTTVSVGIPFQIKE